MRAVASVPDTVHDASMRWKTVIAAVLVGSLVGGVGSLGLSIIRVEPKLIPRWALTMLSPVIICVFPVAAGVLFYAWRTRRGPRSDNFTRCGTCGYILKGLSEPRCPEMGMKVCCSCA